MHCEIGKYSCLGLGYIFPTAMNLFFDCHCLQLWFENHVLLSIWLPPCFLELFILWQNATVNVVYMKIYVISFKYKVKCEMIWIGLNLQCVVLMFLKISFETIWHLIFMSSYCSVFLVQQNCLDDILQTVLLNVFGFSTQGYGFLSGFCITEKNQIDNFFS